MAEPRLAGTEPRTGDVVTASVLAGMLGWGLVGLVVARSTENYPWNVWVPLDDGITNGAVIGLLAGVAAAVALQWGRRAAIVAGAAGALLPGSVRALLGAPQPVLYFEDPMPDAQWYGLTMLEHWTVRTVLPALAVTAAVAIMARFAGTYWSVRLTSIALMLVPIQLITIAYLPAPPPEGNGEHVNEGAIALIGLFAVALVCLWSGVIRLLLAWRRTHRGGAPRPDPVLYAPPPRVR